jgi:hypothetical protein
MKLNVQYSRQCSKISYYLHHNIIMYNNIIKYRIKHIYHLESKLHDEDRLFIYIDI